MSLKQQLQQTLGLDDSRFSNHESDLYILVEGLNDTIVYNFIRKKGWHPIYFVSSVRGQAWYNKLCIDIPFAA